MLRLSRYLAGLLAEAQTEAEAEAGTGDGPPPVPVPPPKHPSPIAEGGPDGPVVIWNLVRRCNLTCRHCYSLSADTDFKDELSGDEIRAVMADLRAFNVPVLILSGGEPLLRPDTLELAAQAKEMGFYVALSTNGTLIDGPLAARIAAVGFDYVGISLDGTRDTHDAFRRKQGAFDAALKGLRLCRDQGVKVGLRFTLTQQNALDLPILLDLVEAEAIDKVYLSHLNYAGRGNHHRDEAALHQVTRKALEVLFNRCLSDLMARRGRDYVTGNNDADGPYLYLWARRHFPAQAEALRQRLQRWGGNASGVHVANIDNTGVVHPDTMWWNHPLGSVRERPFAEIWTDTTDPLMAGLKQRPRPVTGRCGSCRFLVICNGNTRTRAWQMTGDFWAEDPGCYLTDTEIGLTAPENDRVQTLSFSATRRPRAEACA